jgi:hypothetical protein
LARLADFSLFFTGKTTSLSKMIAALVLASPAGGNLVFIYSTSKIFAIFALNFGPLTPTQGLDRAAEVMRAAKSIVNLIFGPVSVAKTRTDPFFR